MKITIVPLTGEITVDCDEKQFAKALERVQTLANASKDMFGNKQAKAPVARSYAARSVAFGPRAGSLSEQILSLLTEAGAPMQSGMIAASLGAPLKSVATGCWTLSNSNKNKANPPLVSLGDGVYSLVANQDKAIVASAALGAGSGLTEGLELDPSFVPGEDDESEEVDLD